MENLIVEKAYSQLFRNLSRSGKRIPYFHWKEFMSRARLILFKQKDLLLEADRLSTHSFFIISGIVMSYFERDGKKYVKWIRGENGYAFSADMFRIDINKQARINGEYLAALEDVVAISISHEDLEWMRNSCRQIDWAILNFYDMYGLMYKRLEMGAPDPGYRYESIQQATDFSFERVPDVYLASYLGISLRDLRKVKRERGDCNI